MFLLKSDGWSDRIDVAKDYYEEAVGSFSIKAYSPKVTEFDRYFTNLNPANNLRNEWFNEYWEEMFKCHIDEATKAKYPTPCKRKCPTGFIDIGDNCYWFSTQSLNWNDARNACKEKHFRSSLLDLNNEAYLEEVFQYLIKHRTISSEHLNEVHARIRLNSDGSTSTLRSRHHTVHSSDLDDHEDLDNGQEMTTHGEQMDQLIFNDENNMSGEQTIKLRYCKSILKDEEKLNQYNLLELASRATTASVEPLGRDYEASLTDENVVTFFDSKINQNLQCLSILIANSSLGVGKKPVYCLKMKNCVRRLPFVCKLEPSSGQMVRSKANGGPEKADFYPDTLTNYQQDPKMSFVVNSLLAVAYGLDRVHQKVS